MADKIRRGQLIAPFGPGAITVIKGGTQLICAGLDHWLERDDQPNPRTDVDIEEFRIEEPRLERALHVNRLYQPPDWRKPSRATGLINARLSVPFLRFPLWHVCSHCRIMMERPQTAVGRLTCPRCIAQGRKRRLVQVRFAAMCDRGHLQDFPWREWVHRSTTPACQQDLKMSAAGASLAAIRVSCGCGQERTLAGIMDGERDKVTGQETTKLTRELAPGQLYTCRGMRPWLGAVPGEQCAAHLRGTLLNATNIYFTPAISAVYLPPEESNAAPAELLDILAKPPFSTFLAMAALARVTPSVDDVRNQNGLAVSKYKNDQMKAAIEVMLAQGASPTTPPPPPQSVSFRLAEYRALQKPRDREELKITLMPDDAYGPIGSSPFNEMFGSVSLIERLRETRAFTGFGRVSSQKVRNLAERKALLWQDQARVDTWLPAYAVFGEGFFLRFRHDRLQEWLSRSSGGKRLAEGRTSRLALRFGETPQPDGNDSALTPTLVMLHTFAHLLINRLTFECGYSSASLRERLYVSSDAEEPMSGVLIYTASGDSEGTMGGLVRMAKPGRLEPLIYRAVENARWCSADPVCMEMAEHGQGPDSCNLAACHACSLVPETSCELFNRFLDRGLVVGTPEQPKLGYFDA